MKFYQEDEKKLRGVEHFQFSRNSSVDTNIISRINILTSKNTTSKLHVGYNYTTSKAEFPLNFKKFIDDINDIFKTKTKINDLFYSLHNICSNMLESSFLAMGLLNSSGTYLNIKLIDKLDSIYTSRIFLNEDNPIAEVFKTKTFKEINSTDFLKIPYLQSSFTLIFPLILQDESIGVFIVGCTSEAPKTNLYQLIANYFSLFVANIELCEKATLNASIDQLTGLLNHRRFQEILSNEIEISKTTKNQFSIIIFDINNIAQINREFGHKKGDEIIRVTADKIKQNIRNHDSAARLGGDEIAVILPDTTVSEAKYLAEYLTYTLSCCIIDDTGPIKVSVGISNYPEASDDQEKLLILAEQAVCISKNKGYKNGISAIVSSKDFNFWDDLALNSFASVLAKHNRYIGIKFEEELIEKFNAEKNVSQLNLVNMVTSLAGAIDAKDPYTKGHSTSVSYFSEVLARAVNLPDFEVERIKLGALLHDIGKIGIPEHILKKPSQLNDEEWEIMKQHPVIGAEKVLMPNKQLHDLIPIVRYHHEHWDGTGYPNGLKNEEIPLAARIVAIADAYHALISDRPYRKGLSCECAIEILKHGMNIQWDANLIREFLLIVQSLNIEKS